MTNLIWKNFVIFVVYFLVRMNRYYEWESRCGALKTGVDGDNGYMTSGVLMPGALDDGVVAEKLVNGLAATPGDRTIINFHDGGGSQGKNTGVSVVQKSMWLLLLLPLDHYHSVLFALPPVLLSVCHIPPQLEARFL